MIKPTLVLMLMLAPSLCSAQTRDCKGIADSAERLRCYDEPLGAAAAPPAQKPTPSREDAFISKAKAVVLKQLRDPASARFSDVKLRAVGGKKGVCGSVNARNAAGGMSGPQFFVYDGQSANVLVLSAGPNNPTSFDADVLAMIFRRGTDNYDIFCK